MSIQDEIVVREYADRVRILLNDFELYWRVSAPYAANTPELWSISFSEFRTHILEKFLFSVMEKHDGLLENMQMHIQIGKSISSVKLCREATGWDLAIAHRAMELVRESLVRAL